MWALGRDRSSSRVGASVSAVFCRIRKSVISRAFIFLSFFSLFFFRFLLLEIRTLKDAPTLPSRTHFECSYGRLTIYRLNKVIQGK